MNRRKVYGNLLLLVAAFVWGSTFVAQSVAAEAVPTFSFLFSRSILGGAVLLPVIALRRLRARREAEKTGAALPPLWTKELLCGGLLCGLALCIASALQQYGIPFTSVGNAGFITAMYILVVPVFGLLFGKKVPATHWISVAIAVVALYLLCIKDGFSVGSGDVLVMLCAVVFAVHILIIDRFSPRVDGVAMASMQFFIVALLSLPFMLFMERPSLSLLIDAWKPIAYAGILSSGIGYTFQIIAQKYTDPTVASLLMSLESVFALLSGMVVLRQIPTIREACGSVLMFAAIIFAQLPFRKEKAAADMQSKGE